MLRTHKWVYGLSELAGKSDKERGLISFHDDFSNKRTCPLFKTGELLRSRLQASGLLVVFTDIHMLVSKNVSSFFQI